MITIIGDTYEELAVLQSVINTGILNDRDMSRRTFNTTYKLSSGNLILTDKYGNIVGEKSKDCLVCEDEDKIRKFIEEHYVPVEDKPGYVWFSKRNMQIISIDLLVAAYLEKGL